MLMWSDTVHVSVYACKHKHGITQQPVRSLSCAIWRTEPRGSGGTKVLCFLSSFFVCFLLFGLRNSAKRSQHSVVLHSPHAHSLSPPSEIRADHLTFKELFGKVNYGISVTRHSRLVCSLILEVTQNPGRRRLFQFNHQTNTQ